MINLLSLVRVSFELETILGVRIGECVLELEFCCCSDSFDSDFRSRESDEDCFV